METEEQQVNDLSLDFEDMEIHNLVTEKLSKLHDDKIKEKQKIIDEQEKLLKEKIKEKDERKNVEEVRKSEELKLKTKRESRI